MATMSQGRSRRSFLGGAGALLAGGALAGACGSLGARDGGAAGPAGDGGAGAGAAPPAGAPAGSPSAAAATRGAAPEALVVSTWDFGPAANAVAWERLAGAGHPLEAVEAGVRVTEADPAVSSVGLGGRPNADGEVELDAAIMRGDTLDCGAVAGVQRILHPVSVARQVMETTPHVLLVGSGAAAFARSRGFPEQDLLTPESRAAWERWREERARGAPEPARAAADHDTIGMIALRRGRFAMAVTTSGWAFKLPGRVGDSPIVGAGGYCDDEAGAAVATGVGEEVIRTCGSFAIVEALRRGVAPEDACREVLGRIRRAMERGGRQGQVGLLAVDRQGRVAGLALQSGFQYALTDASGTRLLAAEVLA